MTDLPELLAPAGSPEALHAAIEGGADAVYFGSVRFSARMRARNFDNSEIADAIALCRAHGVKSYITVNTRLRDGEIEPLLETVSVLNEAGADALIIADLGAASLIRQRFPDLPLHASTQLSGVSSADATELFRLGFSRMVCPRELSIGQIAALCGKSPLEIEMFIHGAHCVSFSGQCMLSYAMGGRSGNRGECAQPCRLPFRVHTESNGCSSEYPLSLKDMCLASHIREIILSGAASLKIEGRQKSADYVYGVTRTYRRLLDERRDATPAEIAELAALFSRDGFTDGYFRSDYRSMLGVRRADDTDASRRAPAFPGLQRKIPLDAALSLRRDTPASLTLSDGTRNVTVSGVVPAAARTAPIDADSAKKNIAKFGATPYVLRTFCAAIDDGLFYTPAQLNALRRRAVDAWNAPPGRRTLSTAETASAAGRTAGHTAGRIRCTAEFLSPAQIPPEAEEFFDEIYLPLRCRTKEYSAILPPYAPDKTLSQLSAALSIAMPPSVMVHSPAQIALAKKAGIPAFASLRLNVFNGRCAREIHALGADLVTMSPEIPLGAVRDAAVPKAVIAYGRLPLMLTLRCAISDGGAYCRSCQAGGFADGHEKNHLCMASLTDRTGTSFPLVGMYDCTGVLYNSVPLYMADRQSALRGTGADVHHFIFSTETKAEAAAVIRAYCENTPPADPAAVRRVK